MSDTIKFQKDFDQHMDMLVLALLPFTSFIQSQSHQLSRYASVQYATSVYSYIIHVCVGDRRVRFHSKHVV